MEIKDTAYFCVQKWMVTKLNLRTVERDVFAIIYGYSQDGDSDFHGSLSYLAELTGYSKNSICTALKSLTDKQLIIKEEKDINNIKFCYYTSNLDTIQALCTGIQALCTNNNINNNTESNNTVSKDTVYVSADQKFEFGKPKTEKPNLYQKCLALIDDYTKDCKISNALRQYLDLCMEMKSIRGANQWKGMLNTLDRVADEHCYFDIIQQSISHGWKTFYPLNNTKSNYSVKQNVEMIQENDYDNYSHKKANREF